MILNHTAFYHQRLVGNWWNDSKNYPYFLEIFSGSHRPKNCKNSVVSWTDSTVYYPLGEFSNNNSDKRMNWSGQALKISWACIVSTLYIVYLLLCIALTLYIQRKSLNDYELLQKKLQPNRFYWKKDSFKTAMNAGG